VPELPEVESARQVVERSGLDRRIVGVDDTDSYVCRPHAPGEIEEALLERRLTAVHRRGKSLWCETSGRRSRAGSGPTLGLHLGMSGQVVVIEPDGTVSDEGGDYQGTRGASSLPDPTHWSRFSLTFADGGQLHLVDKRRLGRVRLDPDLSRLGPDAGEIGRAEFRERVGRGTAPLKARLLDQATLAGVGNLLADEALWQSRLSPRRPSDRLSDEELDELRRQLRRTIRRAIRLGGVHTGELIEHRRTGGHCPRCGSELRRATVGSRTTWWCPAEQT
jgi:formamidopyrimidine-DNA glycosylase